MKPPSITVTIAQWGRVHETNRAIDSVRRSDYEGDIEVLVYDNASPEGPGPVADRSDVRLVQGADNIGFGPAHDALAPLGTGDLLLVLNNDVILTPGAIKLLVAAYRSSDSVGAVTPAYRDFRGATLESGGFVGGSGDGWQLLRGAAPPESMASMRMVADYGSAACLLVDRSWFVDRGGFDDRFAPAYYEDTDLCFDLTSHGKQILVEPRALVFHYEGATAGSDETSGFKRYQAIHRSAFVEKWHHVLQGRPGASFGFAAERAMFTPDERRVLWLAPHLPAADREAGHARIVRMIESLHASGCTVAFWAEHLLDADKYGPTLEAMGVRWFGSNRPQRWPLQRRSPAVLTGVDELLEHIRWSAVVVSFPELAERMIPRVRNSSTNRHTPVLIDNVDLHYLRLERAAESGIEVPGELHMAKERELEIYATSDGVIVASDLEEDLVRTEIEGLPTFAFPVTAETSVDAAGARSDGYALFLGNMTHDPNRDAVDWWIAEIGPALRSIGNDARLVVVGTGSDRYRTEWESSGFVDVVGWVESLDETFSAARTFVAPLRYGAGTKGKLMTALQFGLPIVTTSIGAEGNSSEFAACMRVADEALGFAQNVHDLMTEDSAWEAAVECLNDVRASLARQQQVMVAEFGDWVGRRRRMYG